MISEFCDTLPAKTFLSQIGLQGRSSQQEHPLTLVRMEDTMKINFFRMKAFLAATCFSLATLAAPTMVLAHCDTLDGPVVGDARLALAAGDITPILKWVQAKDEAQIREAFANTLIVRKLSTESQQLADTYFFETLVRIHRAGEGAPYTGLKPAGKVEPAIAKADLALEKGEVDALAKAIAQHTQKGIRDRFATAANARKHADDSVEAGRDYVEAYVTYVHYVEGVVQAVQGPQHHGASTDPASHGH